MVVHCPAHADDTPSLSVKQDRGKVLVHCFGGCSQEAVIEALERRGLWRTSESGLRLKELAKAKGLRLSTLQDWGARDEEVSPGVWRVVIPYRDEAGREVATRYRIALSGDRFRWANGAKPILYGLWRLKDADSVLLVEGETDCWAASELGITALGIPGKSTWKDEWAAFLRGRRVALWVEPDAEQLAKSVALSLPRARLIVPADGMMGVKDLCELVATYGHSEAAHWLHRAWDEAPVGATLFARKDESFAKKQFEAMVSALTLTLCERCRGPIIRWGDGYAQDWPSRRPHACATEAA
jgi:hypothetical protein